VPAREPNFSPPHSSTSLRARFCSAIVLIFALSLRLPTIFSGLPYIDYVDEGYVLHQSISILNRQSLDPKWYGYPSLPAYLTAAALVAYSPVYYLIHGHGFREDLPLAKEVHTAKGDNYDLISPPTLIASGRFVTLLLSLGTVLLTGAIGRLIAGDRVMIIGMLFASACPALASRATNVIVDTFAAFFAAGVFYFAAAILKTRTKNDATRQSAGGGTAAGLAFASKYTVAGLYGAVLLSIVALPVKGQRLRLFAVAGGALLLSASLATPSIAFHPLAVLREVEATAHSYTIMISRPGYFGQAVTTGELGWPLALSAVGGLLCLLRSRENRAVALGYLAFAASLLALFITKPFQPFRNFLALVPPLCIAAAFFFEQLLRSWDDKVRPTINRALILALVSGIVITSGYNSMRLSEARLRHRDSRIKAVDWLQKHIGKTDRVLGIAELGILPAEWKRVGAMVQLAPWSIAPVLIEQDRFDYLVCGKFVSRDGEAAATRSAWARTRLSFVERASFGHGTVPLEPYFWHTMDEQIFVFQRRRE
jgi:Dolichyl-phosphate-mannose-protein mannosyltransferase